MTTLYMFGNGFDIAHGIHTPYSAFRNYLEKEHEEFLTTFEGMYHIQPLDDSEPWYTEDAQQKWKERVLKGLWREFEEKIGNPDVEGMHDFAISLANQMPKEGIKDTLDYYWKDEYAFSYRLQEYVLEWLTTVDTTVAKCKKDALVGSNSDFFINFNYTDTLERVYGIENVLHIHGGVPSCTNVAPIMGHGNRYLIDLYQRKAKEADQDYIEWEESIDEAIARFCKSLYKDTDRIIAKNERFFSNLKDVDQVVCLGLSFGDVDIPYLERIRQEVDPTAKWVIYYYGEESHKRLKSVFGILGISRKFETYFIQSDRFWDR